MAYRKEVVDGSDAIVTKVGERVWQTILCWQIHRVVDALGYWQLTINELSNEGRDVTDRTDY